MVLVDTCVLLDILTNDVNGAEWSLRQLDAAALRGKLLINPVIYAELSVGFDRIETLESAVLDAGVELAEIPRDALFLAAKVFRSYRLKGGIRTGVLPDFFIGAHGAVLGCPLLTRDTRRYRTYFPNLILVSPTA